MRLADIAPGATVTVALPRHHARPAVVHDVYQDGKVGVQFTTTTLGTVRISIPRGAPKDEARRLLATVKDTLAASGFVPPEPPG